VSLLDSSSRSASFRRQVRRRCSHNMLYVDPSPSNSSCLPGRQACRSVRRRVERSRGARLPPQAVKFMQVRLGVVGHNTLSAHHAEADWIRVATLYRMCMRIG
jgi:hypothetical protein